MALTEEQHERDARIQIVLDSYLQTYIDKKPIEEILKAKKKLFEAVDKEVSEAESRAVFTEKEIETMEIVTDVARDNIDDDIWYGEGYGHSENIKSILRKMKELSQLQDKISEEKGEIH